MSMRCMLRVDSNVQNMMQAMATATALLLSSILLLWKPSSQHYR